MRNKETFEGVSPKPTPKVDFSHVIHLLEDPYAATLEERQVFVLKKMLKRCQNGFLLKDVADVFKILNLCVEKAEGRPEYTSVMCDILKICGLPFLKEKSSDEMNYAKTVQESFSQMGYLMRVPSAEVRLQICASIISFFNDKKSKHCVEGSYPISLGYKVEMVEQSGIAEILVLSMALLENQLAIRLQVLQTLQMLSSSSEVNCRKMLKAQGASKICSHMNEPDPSGQVLFRSSEILWNMLEKDCKDEVTSQLSNMDCILSLKDALLNQFLNGFQKYDQQLRNDLLVITSLVAENPKAPLIESGLAKQLTLFATFPEIKSHNPLVRNFRLSFNYEDFEMKKLLFNMLVVMSNDLCSLELFREGQVLLALLLHLRPSERPGFHGWNSVQQGELQLHALSTLVSVAPLLPEDYISCQGNTHLLMLLEWCTEQDTDVGQGHSSRENEGKGDRKAQLHLCVRLLRAMASLGNETINQDLCDQGAITQFLEIIMQLELHKEEEDAVTLATQTDIQQILSVLCENDLHRKELFGSGGVEMLVHFLKISSDKFYSGLGHNKLILSTVDCVWSCVVGCDTTEDMFLEKEGAFLLLDLLHLGPSNMHGVVLGTLLELCDNPKTLPHINTWRGEKGLTAAVLLVQLWRQEGRELGVRHDQQGTVTDAKTNILSSNQEEDQTLPLPADRPTAVVMDGSDHLHAKIFSIFCKIGFEDLPGLTTEDYVTLSSISRYLDFKVMEGWEEIARDLAAEGMRPVTPDREALEAITKMAEDTAKIVATQQMDMIESQKQQDIREEQLLYTEISSNHKHRELTAKSWDHFVAKTSNHKVLVESKKLQEKSINSSRSKVKNGESVFHSTQIAGLHTTHFCGRVMAVESTPSHLVGGPLANTELALERVPIQGGALQTHSSAAQDLEHFHFSSVEAK
ncbi:cilia- and flagella-associated protein 69-like [Megalops cyprinoides]|uniref:cilia- and flagella-associated protein 69-like n=1 Tax=Megalops cyprinoides TaxID=118141 RepID=UPI0018645D82|nr:cilia- and flagella-associated protein 69-like [Megalops cyprinoides]